MRDLINNANNDYFQCNSQRGYQCNRCHHQASLTSGILISASKLPIKICFLAIYFLTKEKNGISTLELSRQLGVSNINFGQKSSFNAAFNTSTAVIIYMTKFFRKQHKMSDVFTAPITRDW